MEMEAIFNRCWVFRDAKCGILCRSRGSVDGQVPDSCLSYEFSFLREGIEFVVP